MKSGSIQTPARVKSMFVPVVIVLTAVVIIYTFAMMVPRSHLHALNNRNCNANKQCYDVGVSEENIIKEVNKTDRKEICKKRLPHAIIAGIRKSGTTALLTFLDAHPNVAACLDPWEPQYFSDHYDQPLEWYRNLMPCSYSNQITVEKSPPYFYRDYCAERIFIMNPKTKIIIIVKDPVVRAISMYTMLKEKGQVGGKEFEDAVTSGNRTTIDTASRFIDFSLYSKYVKAWLDKFDLNQILVLDGHHMESDPVEELNKVENFLQIGHYFTKDKFTFNATKGKYCLSIDKKIDCLHKSKGRKHPDVDTSIIQMMQDYFRPFNEEFFTLVNRRFDWGY